MSSQAPKNLVSPKFSFNERAELLDQLEGLHYPLLVIGGGATGAGCARDAALRGIETLMVDSGDFASGTSSGSSKLIHGGIRYLENFEFSLVFEAIQEREKLKKLYAPFVRPLDFVFPTYRGRKPSKWMLEAGLTLYDSFSFFNERHKSFSRSETLKRYPNLVDSKLTGCLEYADSFVEDYRMVTEVVKSAHRHGAHCISRLKVIGVEKQSDVFAVDLEDQISNNQFRVKATAVVNCAGPFTDEIRQLLHLKPTLHLTQGVHFCLKKEALPIDKAFVLSDPTNNRILFAIPWNSITYLGTTDTSVSQVKDARATHDDLQYVLQITNQYFRSQIKPTDVIQSWAAVRPLIQPEQEAGSNSKISREHQIRQNPEGFFHVLGGKLTSHRLMAEETIDEVAKQYGWKHSTQTANLALQETLYTKQSKSHLDLCYGQHASDVHAYAQAHGAQKITDSLPHLEAEVLYAIHHECALRPLDFLRRRSSMYYEDGSFETAQKVAEIFRSELKFIDQDFDQELKKMKKVYDWDQRGYVA